MAAKAVGVTVAGKKKQLKRHKSKVAKAKKPEPAAGKTRNRTAPSGSVVPPPASLEVPNYLRSESGIPALQMAQWAVIDARSMDTTSIGRVHLPESQALLDKTIAGLMESKDERSQRAGAQLFRLMQDGEDARFKVEMQLRETALEAHQAGVTANLQAKLEQAEGEGVSADVLGQVEAHIHEVVKNAVEQALKKKK